MARTIREKMFIGALLALGISLSGAIPRAPLQRPAAPAFEDRTVLPPGPAGARVRSLIEVINSGDDGRIRRFLDEECDKAFRERIPMDDHVATVLGFRRDTGGLDFYSVRTYTPERPGAMVVIVKDRLLGNWWGLTLRFGPEPESLVAGLGINSARPPAGLVEPPLTETEAVAEIRALLSRLKDKGWLSGAVLVAKGGSVLLTDFGGEASKAFHVPNAIDTKFNLGSMNKMFTAVAVARLVEAGKLRFDDPIGRWVDETWLPKDVTAKITVRHLITHTSGLGSYFNDVYQKSSRALFRRLDDYKPLIRDDRPAFTPGDRFQYSNTGMFLLGVIIEKVTGDDYFDHIRKAIYAPAGMTDSDCYEMDDPVENLAIGYSPDWKSPYGWRNNLYAHVIKGGPAGGGFSTVRDLHRFALALLADKLVSPGTRDLMWTDFKGANYGYGFTVVQSPGGKAVGHSGGFDGINSQLDIYVDSGYIVAAMANVDMGASPLANRIGGILARVKTGS
ncbi:MAG: beta-lactamase family protein [Candidatus Aminicenantes bacterium]|nr:beta-lactamase family protein [Candidatus Aminicenantes bacterium]